MECYHPENNAWTDMPQMRHCRSGAGVAVLNQYIYVVGGFDGSRQLSSVERFDTDRNVWETVTPMKISRSALSVNMIDGKLYAMGGYNGTAFLADVEVYDPVKDEWEDGIPLTSGRSGLASAVIFTPSCHQSYMDTQQPINSSNNREYDDDRKAPDGNDDSDTGISPRGSSSSTYHCSTGFFSGSGGGSGPMNHENVDRLSSEPVKSTGCCLVGDKEQLLMKDRNIMKLLDIHSKCQKNSSATCPIQRSIRRFRHFIFSSRDRNSASTTTSSSGVIKKTCCIGKLKSIKFNET